MACCITESNPTIAAKLGKIFGLSRIKAFSLNAQWGPSGDRPNGFSTVQIEFVPSDEQCDQMLEAFKEYTIAPKEGGDTWRSRGPML